MMSAEFSYFLPPPPSLHFDLIYSIESTQPPLLRLLFHDCPLPSCADIITGSSLISLSFLRNAPRSWSRTLFQLLRRRCHLGKIARRRRYKVLTTLFTRTDFDSSPTLTPPHHPLLFATDWFPLRIQPASQPPSKIETFKNGRIPSAESSMA